MCSRNEEIISLSFCLRCEERIDEGRLKNLSKS